MIHDEIDTGEPGPDYVDQDHRPMTKRRINRAIRDLGLEIVGNRWDGYYYFLDTETGFQVGESVMVCYLKHDTLEGWVAAAKYAREQSLQDKIL